MIVGIERTPYLTAMSCSSSVFTLTILALPSKSSASSSTTGAIIRQGPHHGAQKSTIDTPSAMVASKSADVDSIYLAIILPLV
jgi:hypothetical protein